MTERLALSLRALLEAEGGAERLSKLFRARHLELAEALTSAQLAGILRHAWDRRNKWSGHGGVAGQHVHRVRLGDLEDLLVRTEALLGWSFEPWTLLKPGPMTRSGKVFDLTATILKGPNSAFRRKQLQLTEALDTSLLYLLEDGSRSALELVPFIRLLAGTTGQDACYFYNRMEGTEARWVSYHYHQDPELLLPDDGLAGLLANLTGPGTVAED